MSDEDADDLFPPDWQPAPLDMSRFEHNERNWSKPKRPGARTNRQPENKVRDKLEKYLKSIGAKYTRVNSGSWKDVAGNVIMGAKAGTSDYLAIIPIDIAGFRFGVFAAIEAKAPGNKPTEPQQRYIDAISKRGGIAIVAYSPADIEREVMAYTERLTIFLARLAKIDLQ